ncbi:MAG: sensor histidine kinase [Gammaproteobacteria bacterium]|nr:sensor histidine kinase [Gammaproteobacteria bacterium]
MDVSVTDNGIGFEATRSPSVSRSGERFGLFNVRNRIEYFGGTVLVQSLPGAGTTVKFSLPVDRPSRNQAGDGED